MPDMVIIIGIQGSGKSTFHAAKYPDYTRINLDTLRTRKKEKDALRLAISRKENIIIDNTNPTKADRVKYIEVGKASQYKITGCFMESEPEDCIERNNNRTGKEKIPVVAIYKTWEKLEKPNYEEGFDELFFVQITDEGFQVSKWEEFT